MKSVCMQLFYLQTNIIIQKHNLAVASLMRTDKKKRKEVILKWKVLGFIMEGFF